MKEILCLLFAIVFVGCSGTKNQYKIEKKPILSLKESYYQSYISGVEGGGSGVTVFLVQDKHLEEVKLVGLYFREKYTKLKSLGNNKFQGHIKGRSNLEKEVLMIGETKKEKKSRLKTVEKPFPFHLGKNEAVISFLHKGKIKYNKIELTKKEVKTFPM